MKKGKIIVIVAPSGTGKSTLIKRLRLKFDSLEESVSFTTRPMRPNEQNGKDYLFIGKDEFDQKRNDGDFLEWAQVHSNFYGTSKTFVEKKMEDGKTLLFDLDVQGALYFKEYFQNKAAVIFIQPPSLEELEQRLRDRGTETDEVIRERIKNARVELEKKDQFDYLVTNEDIDLAYAQIEQIFQSIIEG